MRSLAKAVEPESIRRNATDQPLEPPQAGAYPAADGIEHSLALADVLEQEFREVTSEREGPPPPWEFDVAQILEPELLRTRLVDGRDVLARDLANAELRALVQLLRQSGAPNGEHEVAALRAVLAAGFNALLARADLYSGDPESKSADPDKGKDSTTRFAAVRFRSQTRQRIATGSVIERNRLILEDAFPEIESRDDARLARLFARAHKRKFAALCLSGGGIRSASFALGIVQGLARLGLLKRFDYLSTVSGGGYLGGWLSAWMRRSGRDRVAEELGERTGRPLAPEPAPLVHLRTYSSYLSPRIGLESADTWTLAAIYLRNLFLNWLVLIPLLAAAMVVPQLLVALMRLPRRDFGDLFVLGDAIFVLLLGLSIASAAASVRYLHANRPIEIKDDPGAIDDPRRDHHVFMRWCFLPMLGAVTGIAVIWSWVASGKVPMLALPGGPDAWQMRITLDGLSATFHAAWIWGGLGALIHFGGWFLARRRLSWREFLFVLAMGALGGLAAGAILHALVPSQASRTFERLEHYAWYASFAVPSLLASLLVFGHLYVGMTSRSQPDATFEWSARYSAWLQIAIVAWLVASAIAILVPLALGGALQYVQRPQELVESGRLLASLLGVGAGLVTLRQAYKAPIGAGTHAGLLERLVQVLALPVFLIALLVAMSYLVGSLMGALERLSPFFIDLSCPSPDPSSAAHYFHDALNTVICGTVPSVLVVLVALAAGGYLLSLRIDTNRFSLHGMYRSRLIRTFLAASRPEQERNPNRFTGFDENDDVAMADLRQGDRPAPLHVVNVALNLVSRGELATHQRKAASFTFTPLHSGSASLGYRPTRDYGGGVTLGTAITISGAAASPEMGHHTKPLLSFLLTVFNVRLGWWLGNPAYSGRRTFRDAAPTSSVQPIVDEALGRTDDRNPYVYLSDGGHFENLGLYEMVLRRCHWIVVSDAGCDPQGGFEDLGNAIRRVRVDFGISITFDKIPIYSRGGAADPKPDATSCAIGRIRYCDVDGDVEDGTLIYIKPAFYGNEPPDVFNYARTCPAFPHEPTSNQFFTQAQFESYRRLGTYTLENIAGREPGLPAQGPKARPRLTFEAFAARIEAHLGSNGARTQAK